MTKIQRNWLERDVFNDSVKEFSQLINRDSKKSKLTTFRNKMPRAFSILNSEYFLYYNETE